ncbi:MAG: helix-turn-helix transcriptional regulator [Methanobacteriota archaeon]|nr:MAG: helix-turn-helix transcriptional regulator [Euryarchaeota archaeon]
MARKGTAEKEEGKIYPLLAYQADPIRESVKWLGRKWTLLILRDMAFLKLTKFGQILRNNPGLTPRVLSRRLRQMQQEGLVERVVADDKVAYRLTSRGEDAVFILLAFLRYGIRHHLPSQPADAARPES